MSNVVPDEGPTRIASIRYESKPSKLMPILIQFDLQFVIDLQEESMAITNAELRIGAESIKNHFKGSLSSQFF
jgi:hypothetical protein